MRGDAPPAGSVLATARTIRSRANSQIPIEALDVELNVKGGVERQRPTLDIEFVRGDALPVRIGARNGENNLIAREFRSQIRIEALDVEVNVKGGVQVQVQVKVNV